MLAAGPECSQAEAEGSTPDSSGHRHRRAWQIGDDVFLAFENAPLITEVEESPSQPSDYAYVERAQLGPCAVACGLLDCLCELRIADAISFTFDDREGRFAVIVSEDDEIGGVFRSPVRNGDLDANPNR